MQPKNCVAADCSLGPPMDLKIPPMHDSCFCSAAGRRAASGNNAGASLTPELSDTRCSCQWIELLFCQRTHNEPIRSGRRQQPMKPRLALRAVESLRNRRALLGLDHRRVSRFMRRASIRLSAADTGRRCSDLAGVQRRGCVRAQRV